MKKVVLFIVCVVLGLQSCTKENLEDCIREQGLRLKVAYLLPYGDDNTPAPNVQHIKAYVFNEQDVLCAIGEGNEDNLSANSAIDINLPAGKYKIVVWGSDATSLQTSYDLEATVNKTTFTNLLLSLKGAKDETTAEFNPAGNEFSDLYYGISGTRIQGTSEYVVKEIEIPTNTVTEETVELIRNTNQLNITVEEYQNLSDWPTTNEDIDIYVLGKGTSYDKDNHFVNPNDVVKYSPYHTEFGDNSLSLNLKTQRIRKDMFSESPLTFYIYNKKLGKTLYKLDILEQLLKVENTEGNRLYQNQEDLDRIYIHNITIRVAANGLTIKVFINNWEVIDLYPVH